MLHPMIVQKAAWSRRFLQNLGLIPHATDPIVNYHNSMAALVYVKDLKYNGKSKHKYTFRDIAT